MDFGVVNDGLFIKSIKTFKILETPYKIYGIKTN